MNLVDIQIDRMVGPTHHFGGLGVGNLASAQHAGQRSSPKAAAIEGLQKMMQVAQTGAHQFVLPPQSRPDWKLLHQLGFSQPSQALHQAPEVASAVFSCSAMWTANAGTFTPAVDSTAGVATLTIANLVASLHRSIEPEQTAMELRDLLPKSVRMEPPLPGGAAMRDEGAANHMRLAVAGKPGLNLFVYGDGSPKPVQRWPRQTRAACESVSRSHQLIRDNTFFLKQHPVAIDAGAFHNDVVALSHGDVWIHHELAYQDDSELERIEDRWHQLHGRQLRRIEVPGNVLSMDDAVKTYLFNSQIVQLNPDQAPTLFCPVQVREHPAASELVQAWIADGIFGDVHYMALNQSMSSGGGPACLRLRVTLPPDQVQAMPANARLTEQTYDRLLEIVSEGYPETISLAELVTPERIQQAESVTLRLQDALRCSRA